MRQHRTIHPTEPPQTARGGSAKPHPPQSHDEFIRRLRQLGASVGTVSCVLRPRISSVQVVRPVFASCSLQTWTRTFGAPEGITDEQDVLGPSAYQVWEQRCGEGPVTCMGQVFNRGTGPAWVIVREIRFF
jgi:hypothetical protein